MRNFILASALAFFGAIGAAGAAPITYTVDLTIGAGGVEGSVTTDGTIGVLDEVNFLDWTLELTEGAQSFTLLGPLSGNNSDVLVSGTAATATATGLFFNFDGSGFVLFQNPNIGSGQNWFCIETGSCNNNTDTFNVRVGASGLEVSAAQSGVVQWASAEAVPAPAALALFGLGLGLLAWRQARRA